MFSCENTQEFYDLNLLMSELYHEHKSRIIYFNLSKTTGVPTKENGSGDYWTKEYNSIRVFNNDLKQLSPLKKLITSLINALYLFYICIVNKVDRVVVGVPLLSFRMFRLLSTRRIKLISLIRSVIAQSEKNTSLSSKIFLKYGSINRFGWIKRLLSDYYADKVICVGETTRLFLLSRSVPDNNIKVIGSVYCDSKAECINVTGEKIIVFISSAFEWHGDSEAQYAQTELIRNINNYLSVKYRGRAYKFFIRPHPREAGGTYTKESDLVSFIDYRNDPISDYPSNTLYISVVSNMIFELNALGRQSRLISNEYFLEHLSRWCAAIGISPIVNWERVLDDYLLDNLKSEQKCLDNVISKKYAGFVVSEISNEILI